MRIPALCAFAALLLSSCSPGDSKNNLTFDLNALSGRWEMVSGNERTIEEWVVEGGIAKGVGVVLFQETDTVFIEYMRIEPVDTTWQYVVRNMPDENSPSVPFRMTRSSSTEMVFENPSHDHPNLICYQLKDRNSLHAWIEGMSEGEKSRTDFEYVRK